MAEPEWVAVEVEVPRGEADLVSGLLLGAGAAGIEELDPPGEARPLRQAWDSGPEPPPPPRVVLKAWFADPDRAGIEASLGERTARWLAPDATDWSEAWKAEHRAVRVGALVIAPPWCATAGDGVVLIEPGQGFGTGDHPTTRGVLEALQDVARPGWSVLDVGCGSGVLALAAARLGLGPIVGIDTDAAAIAEAEQNALRNGLAGEVAFAVRGAADHAGSADLVLANLHAAYSIPLAPRLLALAQRALIVGGVPPDREAEAAAAFTAAGWVLDRRELEGWVTLCLTR